MSKKKVLLALVLDALVTLGGIGFAAQNVRAATVSGTVDNITASNINVEGLTILTDNNTSIKGTVVPGAFVRIHTTTQNGSPLALQIQAKENNRAIKIEGIVDNVTGNRISINGKVVYTDNKTLIRGTLISGAHVEIKARTQTDGSLLAFQIKVKEEKEHNKHGKYVEIEGTASNLTATSVVVDGKTIKIDGNTKIKGSLVNDATVEVKAVAQSDGSLLAAKIEVIDASEQENEEDGED